MRRFIPVTILMPLFGASLGIDGGPIFQILAVENLGLGATAIGVAFGLGVVSLPIQLYATRIPLRLAKRNVQLFLLITGAQAWLLAALVAAEATGGLAAVALAVTVTAEIAVSVLFATAWQPLLSATTDSTGRQRLNSTWPAVARGLLAGLLVVFAALGDQSRAVFLVAVGVLAVASAIGLNHIPQPRDAKEVAVGNDAHDVSTSSKLSPQMRLILFVFAAINIGAIPLWLIYLNNVLWPTGNLGLVAGVQTAASMLALLAWRPTDVDVSRRALLAAVAALVTTGAIPLVPSPVSTTAAQATILAITAILAITNTIVRVAMLETAHRAVTSSNSVRAFTVLDVVASTSLQLGLLLAGLLITASKATTTWPLDPYQLFIIITAVVAALTVYRHFESRSLANTV